MINNIDFDKLNTPCYVVDESLLIKNLEVLKYVEDRTGCHILLAQKGFSMYSVYPLISKYLSGVTSSSLFEAKLGFEEMGKEVHIYSPAYREDEFDEILKYCGHVVFNSFEQLQRFKDNVKEVKAGYECGLTIEKFNDIKEGDIIEGYEDQQVKDETNAS